MSAFQELAQSRPGLLLILVPRKPERFDEAEAKLRAAGVRYVRRSQETIPDRFERCRACCCSIPSANWPACFRSPMWCSWEARSRGAAATMSWSRRPVGKAIVTGPHLENFAAIAAEFREQRAFLRNPRRQRTGGAVAALLDDRELREDLGARAAALAAGKARGNQKSRVRDSPLAGPGHSMLEPVEPGAILALAAGQALGRGERPAAAAQNGACTAPGHAGGQRGRHQHGWGGENSHGGSSG